MMAPLVWLSIHVFCFMCAGAISVVISNSIEEIPLHFGTDTASLTGMIFGIIFGFISWHEFKYANKNWRALFITMLICLVASLILGAFTLPMVNVICIPILYLISIYAFTKQDETDYMVTIDYKCPVCDYDVRGSIENKRCPECGWRIKKPGKNKSEKKVQIK